MKVSSAKAKGRRCALETAELLYKYAPDLRPGDILATSSGACGEDLLLSPAARELYPFAIECKNVESLNVWKAYDQAKSHCKPESKHIPILFFRRNRSDLMVCMRAEDFIKQIR